MPNSHRNRFALVCVWRFSLLSFTSGPARFRAIHVRSMCTRIFLDDLLNQGTDTETSWKGRALWVCVHVTFKVCLRTSNYRTMSGNVSPDHKCVVILKVTWLLKLYPAPAPTHGFSHPLTHAVCPLLSLRPAIYRWCSCYSSISCWPCAQVATQRPILH